MTLVYLNLALGGTIFLLNFLEVLLIIKRRKRIKPYEQLLSSLAVADALTGLLLVVSKLFILIHNTTKTHKLASNILSCITLTTVIISIASLASIAIDRILAVKYPLYHRRWVTKSRVWCCAIMEWMATWILVTIPILVGNFSSILPNEMTQVYKKITSWLVIIFGLAFCLGYAELVRSLVMRPNFDQMKNKKFGVGRKQIVKKDKGAQRMTVEVASPKEQANITIKSQIENQIDHAVSGPGGEQNELMPQQNGEEQEVKIPCAVKSSMVDSKKETVAKARSCSWNEFVAERKQRRADTRSKQRSASDNQELKQGREGAGASGMTFNIEDWKEMSCNNAVNKIRCAKSINETTDKLAKAKSKREGKIARTVALTCVLIVLTYLVCTTPYAVQILTGGDPLNGWTGLMLFSNSLFNPLIYFFKGYLESLIRRKEKPQPDRIITKQKDRTKTLKSSTNQNSKRSEPKANVDTVNKSV